MIYVLLGLLAGLSMFGGATYSRRQRTISECARLGHAWARYTTYQVCDRCGRRISNGPDLPMTVGVGAMAAAAFAGIGLALLFSAWATDRVIDAVFALFRS